MGKPLGKSKIVVIHPMKSQRHSEKAHRCIACGNRLKDAIHGREMCSCGVENVCTSRLTGKSNNIIVYVTEYYTM